MKNEDLRRKLAEKFDDFEAEPAPQTWDTIRAAIEPKQKKRSFFVWWLLAGLLLGGGGAYAWFSTPTFLGKKTHPSALNTEGVPSQKNNVSPQTGELSHNQILTHTKKSNGDNAVNSVDKPVNKRDFVLNNTIRSVDKVAHAASVPVEKAEKLVHKMLKTVRSEQKTGAGYEATLKERDTKKTVFFDSPKEEVFLTDKNIAQNQHTVVDKILVIKKLHIASPQALPSLGTVIQTPKIVTQKFKMTPWITLGASMTYQHITVETNANVAQVQNPRTFAPQRLGFAAQYGVSIPLSKKSVNTHLLGSLNYSMQPQWSDYQLTDPQELTFYRVNTLKTRAESFVAERISTPFSERSNVHRVGVSVGIEQLFTVAGRKMALSGLGTATWRGDTGAFEYWTTASFRVPLTRRERVWAAPFFQYSLSQTIDNQQLSRIRPLNFGLNMYYRF